MLREAESDLRSRRFDGDAVPADAAAAHLVCGIARDERLRGLAGDIPGEGCDEDGGDDRRGEGEDGAASECPANGQAVGLQGGDKHQVNRGQIPHHRVRNRHLLEHGWKSSVRVVCVCGNWNTIGGWKFNGWR